MKRDFLLNLTVEGKPLPKEVVDAIMGENGKDIESVKANYSDYNAIKEALNQAKETIAAWQAQDVEGLKQSAQDWENKYNQAVREHSEEISNLQFQQMLNMAVSQAKGRNAKAICALLDLDALKNAENRAEAIGKALEELKKDSGYLFAREDTPPLYARGTGTQWGAEERSPVTLAGALRERFENERK